MATLPSALALTSIADGSPITAADHRNNYAAVQTEANALLTILGSGVTGQMFTGNGTTVSMAYPPGFTIGHDQITAPVTVSSAVEATGTTVIAGSSHVFDGAPVLAEFYCPQASPAAATGAFIVISLFEGATQAGEFAVCVSESTTAAAWPVCAKLQFTPSAASHTYSVTAFQSGGNGTIVAGPGGTAAKMPAYLRFTKV